MFPLVEVVETTNPAVFSMSAESLLVRQRKHIGRLRLTMMQITPNIRAGAGNISSYDLRLMSYGPPESLNAFCGQFLFYGRFAQFSCILFRFSSRTVGRSKDVGTG